MIADCELLELAAKAAEIKELAGLPYRDDHGIGGWNPLTNDGDALRLAVSLELDIMHRVVGGTRVEILSAGGPLTKEFYEGEQHRLAATRRAIVRASAGIGRAMP